MIHSVYKKTYAAGTDWVPKILLTHHPLARVPGTDTNGKRTIVRVFLMQIGTRYIYLERHS